MAELMVMGVSKSYGSTQVLKDVSVVVHEGEIVCLLGISGVGKTTLFNVISGLEVPDKGQVLLDGTEITGRAGAVSYMLQKDMLLPYRTIEDNVILPLLIRGEKKKAARERVQKFFVEFGIEGTQKMYPGQLSGGMRQRAALLRTYLFSDRVALLDEPFSALDMLTKGKMHQWYLGVMKEIRLGTMFITHDIDEGILLSDRIYILGGKPGRIVGEIPIEIARDAREHFNLTEDFLSYKKKILRLIGGGGVSYNGHDEYKGGVIDGAVW
jgi:ABC-type nitrate/sulfonate/bicarbonate transport system ATPase subunit